MKSDKNIAVIGGGSWATAIVKMLTASSNKVCWWMRSEDQVQHLIKYKHNPKYLRSVELPTDIIDISYDINYIVEKADFIIFAIPSAFLKEALKDLKTPFNNKVIVSAIKGIIPDDNLIVGEFFHEKYNVPLEQICVISGPCHAEEVGMERLSYLTIAGKNEANAKVLANALTCNYIQTKITDDIYGTEYGAVLKNIYALAAGIFHGLGYGDNFQAVLVSNAIREMKRFIKAVHPIKRDINGSAYLGDLLVTSYSQFSRNRTFGNMIGNGYTIKSVMLEMNMVAEGYYASKLIRQIQREKNIKMPISNAVYKILYEGKSPKKIMAKLATKLN